MIPDHGASPKEPSPVLALSIFDGPALDGAVCQQETRVLVAVRDAATNDTHPNVISVPTQRVPRELFDALVDAVRPESYGESITFLAGEEVDSDRVEGHHPLIYAVCSMLSRKLGVGGHLESGDVAFRASLRAVSVGHSTYHQPVHGRTVEHIIMANAAVVVTRGSELFPARTPSYSHISWIAISRFMQTVRDKNPLVLDLNPMEYCVHGLCVASTYDLLANPLGMQPYAMLSDLHLSH